MAEQNGVDTRTLIATTVSEEERQMIDMARDKMAMGGAMISRSGFVRGAIHFYLKGLGYQPEQPVIGRRRSTGGSKGDSAKA